MALVGLFLKFYALIKVVAHQHFSNIFLQNQLWYMDALFSIISFQLIILFLAWKTGTVLNKHVTECDKEEFSLRK